MPENEPTPDAMAWSWRREAPMLALLAAMVVASVVSWPFVDDQIPMHWDIQGEIDRYGGKVEGLFLLPGITAGLYLLLAFLPRLDPAKHNYGLFAGSYALIRLAIIGLMAAIHAFVLATAHGYDLDIAIVAVGVGILFIVLGNAMGKLRPNYFAGIRTPWTLTSVRSWNASHRIGGWVFTLGGLGFLGMILVREPWYLVTILVLQGVALVGVVVYSWWVWRSDPDRVPAASSRPAEE